MAFEFSVPGPANNMNFTIEAGSSVIFVGANGGGKSRLAVRIESVLGLDAHRISAHRALTLNPEVPKIKEQLALFGLRTGAASPTATVSNRSGSRWHNNIATSLLNDFDFLIQALFADQANVSLKTHKRANLGVHTVPEPTKFERLVKIWEAVLPDRRLHVSGDDIKASAPIHGTVHGPPVPYDASELSDGERAIFYLIGQALCAADNSLLVIDEPELHVHRAIMAKLWDELEAARQDCAFVFITHDLEFAASRVAQKFVVRDYTPTPTTWVIEEVPDNTGFDEELTTLILGSRRPILFVEGEESSLDQAIYRCCYPDWTVVPRGSCEEVIHSVVTMRRNADLTRVTCSGIVDADDYQPDEVTRLDELGISVLRVSEIENIILLPNVSRTIAESEGHAGASLDSCLDALKTDIFKDVRRDGAIEAVVTRYCRRRIDRLLKRVDLSEADDVISIAAEYQKKTAKLNIADIALQARTRIEDALGADDLSSLLANFDDKGLMANAGRHLKKNKKGDFESWLARVLSNGKVPELATAIRDVLPDIRAQ